MERMRNYVLVAVCFCLAGAGRAGVPGYLEEFALAPDRAEALAQLIPGTEEFYFYSCLVLQQQGKLGDVDKVLAQWIAQHKRTARVIEIENRQALLRYATDPQAALEFIQERLDLRFDHQREVVGRAPDLPTALEQSLIGRPALTERALARHKGTLGGLEDRALDWAVGLDLDPDRRRDLLGRLKRPDYPGLPRLVVDDLEHKGSRGFGSLDIHRLLLLPQLDECAKRKPDLRDQGAFVNAYLAKLRPSPDVDWRNEPAAERAYLERLWDFVLTLAPVHNSLKAHVLYRRLAHDRSQGVYDRERFMTYLKLPRNAGYVSRKYLGLQENRGRQADLAASFTGVTLFPPVGNDEELVRDFLGQFFLEEDSYGAYEPYVDGEYLTHLFAETKILAGLGDMERWYAMLPPERYQALKERVDLDFVPTNKTVFGAGEPVVLELFVKNVETLLVKVFELNTVNYFRTHLKELDTAIDLDGLVANEETTHTYREPPLRRVKRRFEFPSLAGRGAYVVEFIGNGKSSRALVRKGTLRYLVRTSCAGQVFTVLDEADRKLAGAALYVGGRRYGAEEDGTIVVPFTAEPGRKPVVLVEGDVAALDFFEHQAESYALSAGIYVDREALLAREKAACAVRAQLTLNGTPVPLSVLESPELVLTSTDAEGVDTTKEVEGFTLSEDKESVYEFQVPPDLARLTVTLKGKVEVLSRNEKADLGTSQAFTLNGIDATEKIEDLHLIRAGGEYALDLLGKTGEVRPQRPVALVLKHRDFRDPVEATVKTDEQGRVALGALSGIEWLSARGPEGTEHRWHLAFDRHSYPATLNAREGEALFVPYMGESRKPVRSELSLLEMRGGTFAGDRFEALSIEGGYVRLSGLAPGDYDLWLKRPYVRIAVRVAAGEPREGYVLGGHRQLEISTRAPLQIAGVQIGEEALRIRLSGATPLARVHVAAVRYFPEYPIEGLLAVPGWPEPAAITVSPPETLYVIERDIGDEYRYVIDRRYAQKYAGNMLERPGLLLNPWAIRTTETGRQEARAGEEFDRKGQRGRPEREEAEEAPDMALSYVEGGFANLDFLGEPAAVLLNLEPGEDGVVTVDRADLGPHHHLRIVAVDPQTMAFREVTLPEQEGDFKDLRLASGLDPEKHFTERKEITVVPAGGAFVLEDIATSDFETYDTLGKVYALQMTLSKNPTLAEFAFLLTWPSLGEEEKRAKYSEYACHELSFFVHRKDPEFFQSVVRPYLTHKYHKTFMDEWLTEAPLAKYREPWAYERLNVVERILLGQRIGEERPCARRHVEDLFALVPPDMEEFVRLFSTAIRGRALETADELGVKEAREKLSEAAHPDPAQRLPALERTTAASGLPARGRTRFAAIEELVPVQEDALADLDGALGRSFYAYGEDLARRKAIPQLYQVLEKTKEWVENNYYKLPIEEQDSDLVTVNAFWRDFAAHDGTGSFFSTNLAEASRSFTEMALALAVLDLPFEAGKHTSSIDGSRLTLTAGSPMVVFHKEIEEAEAAPGDILVSQNFYRHGERYVQVGNEKRDKFVTGEFLVHTVYGCHVVVTNPTSTRQKVVVLLQIPRGALPVMKGRETRSLNVDLEPYRTWTADYFFYFPAPGAYAHYPVQVARDEKVIGFAPAATLTVVAEPTTVDRTSWDYVSQNGSQEDVLEFLEKENLEQVKLDRIAWRMKDRAFFDGVTALLARRHLYDHTLWSYALKHNALEPLRQYLLHADDFIARCGAAIETTLLTIDPVERRSYQHMEYRPLVNARAHRLGPRRQILNDRFFAQYMRFLTILSYRPRLDDDDLMGAVYYLLLQDRTGEAAEFFERVRPERLAARLQYDYFDAYLGLSAERLGRSRELAARYADYPVDRWRKLFRAVAAQLDEIEGAAPAAVDEKDRTQRQTGLAAAEAALDFTVESGQVTLTYQGLKECRVNYYLMDLELLFSRNPFVGEYGEQFGAIRPNATASLALDPGGGTHTFALPDRFKGRNVLIEILGGGKAARQPYFSHELVVTLSENYAQLKVTHKETGRALGTVYVKVYARMKGGLVRFYKDGYTDLRGRFDYGSLSTDELDHVERFSILVMSDDHGALVREAAPPAR